jgi:CHRD domain
LVYGTVNNEEEHMRQTFDRRSVLGIAVGGAAGAVMLASAKPGHAAAVQYKAALKSSDEVPPNPSAGTGAVTVSYDASTKQVTWQGTFSGLTGPATAGHIHGPAEPGKNAGVVVPLSQKDTPFTSPFQGSATLTDAQAADLASGLYYVNIHTDANKGGEIRGQLAKA